MIAADPDIAGAAGPPDIDTGDLMRRVAEECHRASRVVEHLQDTIGHLLEAGTDLSDEALRSLQEADGLRQTLTGLAGLHRGAAGSLPPSSVPATEVLGWVGLPSLAARLARKTNAPTAAREDDRPGHVTLF